MRFVGAPDSNCRQPPWCVPSRSHGRSRAQSRRDWRLGEVERDHRLRRRRATTEKGKGLDQGQEERKAQHRSAPASARHRERGANPEDHRWGRRCSLGRYCSRRNRAIHFGHGAPHGWRRRAHRRHSQLRTTRTRPECRDLNGWGVPPGLGTGRRSRHGRPPRSAPQPTTVGFRCSLSGARLASVSAVSRRIYFDRAPNATKPFVNGGQGDALLQHVAP